MPSYWITPRLLTQSDGGASSDKSFSNIVKNVSPFISTVTLCDNVMQLIYPFAKGKCYRKKIIKSDGLLAYQCIKKIIFAFGNKKIRKENDLFFRF